MLERRHLLAAFEVTTLIDATDPIDGVTSLREAIELANANPGADEITFLSTLVTAAPRRILLTGGELVITDTLVLTGPGQDQLAIDANQQSRVLNIDGVAIDVALSGLAISGGATTGNNEFVDGSRETTHSGGGIRFESTGTLTLSNVTLSGNGTKGDRARGGGIFTRAGRVDLVDSTLSNNRTAGFGAFGGGIATSSGNVVLTKSIVSNNQTNGSFGFGGGLFTDSGNVSLVDSSLSGNSTVNDAPGGGIYSQSGDVTLERSTLSGNSTGDSSPGGIGGDGGGIYAVYGNVTLTNSTLSNNSTSGDSADGGGIFTRAGDVTLAGSTLFGNRTSGVQSHGGGVFTSSGNVTLANSTLSGNRAEGPNSDGGAIWLNNSLATIRNSTITGNTATRAGGGLWILADSTDKKLTIHNSIIAGNFDNRIASDFSAPTTPAMNLEVRSSLIGSNLGTSLSVSETADATGNFVGSPTAIMHPHLGPLQNNGGLTLTHGLLATSPAIDAGDDTLLPPGTVTDQRGFTRTADLAHVANAGAGDGMDIGAVEMVAVSIASAAAFENAGPLGFIVSLSHAIPIGSSVSVEFNTSDDTHQAIAGRAIAEIDYTAICNQSIVFTGGGTLNKTVIVPLVDESLFESNETFTAALSNPVGAVLASSFGTGTIANDDAPPTFSLAVDNATIAESAGVAKITATLSVASGVPVIIDLAFNGTASFPDDYNRSETRIVIPAGQTSDSVTFIAVQDANHEADETVIVDVSNVTGAVEATPQSATITIANREPLDFGDAPEVYPVTVENEGAAHVVGALFLGGSIDFELDGQPSATASGDGIDDDGIVQTASQFTSGDSATGSSFAITASASGKLDAWLDFNQDGDWTDDGEQILNSVNVVAGVNVLAYTIPAGAIAGETFARFRLSSLGSLAPTGVADDGEVEDYRYTLVDTDHAAGVVIEMVHGSITLASDSIDTVVRSENAELFRARSSLVSSINVNGTAADDTITIDFTSGIVVPSGGLNLVGAGGTNTIRIQGAGTLDLTNSAFVLRDIDSIELPSNAANKVTVDAVAIAQNSPARRSIQFTIGALDQIEVIDATQWRMIDPMVVDGRFVLSAQRLNPGTETIRVDSARPYRNFLQIGDVNNSGNVSASDALEIVLELNSPRFSDATGELVDPTGLSSLAMTFLDVNGDGKVSALDALDVINMLFQQSIVTVGVGEQLIESPGLSDQVILQRVDARTLTEPRDPTIAASQSRVASSIWLVTTNVKVIVPMDSQDLESESKDAVLADTGFLQTLVRLLAKL